MTWIVRYLFWPRSDHKLLPPPPHAEEEPPDAEQVFKDRERARRCPEEVIERHWRDWVKEQ